MQKLVKPNQFDNLEIELKLRGYSRQTIRAYIFCNRKFLEYVMKSPRDVTKEDIRRFLFELIEICRLKPRTINLVISALKFYYDEFNNKSLFRRIKRVKVEKDIPTVLTKEEIEAMIAATTNPKHKLLIELLFGSGLRVGEAVKIKVKDIFPERKIGIVKMGKGKKDRFVILSTKFIFDMVRYLKIRKEDSEYLFGVKLSHISIRTAEKIVQNAAKRADIKKRTFPHALRASFATELFHNNIDVSMISRLMGHARLRTTQGYIKYTTRDIERVASPLDSI